jgi:hypothetical protein
LESFDASDGGDTLDVGDDKDTSSSVFQDFLLGPRVVSALLLVTTLLLFSFLDLRAGESWSLLVGGDGGELACQARGRRLGGKKAGFVGMLKRDAAIRWLAISS